MPRILLEIEPGPPIHGRLRACPRADPDMEPAGEARTFSGWLALLSELQAALGDQPDVTPRPAWTRAP